MKKLALILMAAAVCVACNKTAEKQQTTPAEEVVVVEEAVAEVPEAVEEEIAPEDIPQRVQMPEFPGGMDELMKYLSDNIQYPSKAKNYQAVLRYLGSYPPDNSRTRPTDAVHHQGSGRGTQVRCKQYQAGR